MPSVVSNTVVALIISFFASALASTTPIRFITVPASLIKQALSSKSFRDGLRCRHWQDTGDYYLLFITDTPHAYSQATKYAYLLFNTNADIINTIRDIIYIICNYRSLITAVLRFIS